MDLRIFFKLFAIVCYQFWISRTFWSAKQHKLKSSWRPGNLYEFQQVTYIRYSLVHISKTWDISGEQTWQLQKFVYNYTPFTATCKLQKLKFSIDFTILRQHIWMGYMKLAHILDFYFREKQWTCKLLRITYKYWHMFQYTREILVGQLHERMFTENIYEHFI